MPELPEVETTRRGVAAHLIGERVTRVTVRESRLRWPVTRALARELPGQRLAGVRRRAKYLLLDTAAGCAIVHLGMSGSLRVVPEDTALRAHDHVDIHFDSARILRFNDPRRFGSLLWTRGDPLAHPLLAPLGPEPLEEAFDGAYLHAAARGRRAPAKSFLMDGRVVAGVGNIYANEALHLAGIHPKRAAGRITRARYDVLAGKVKEVLAHAIEHGGTTLRDFLRADGEPGYFRLELRAYERAGQPCRTCGTRIRRAVIAQRASYYCPRCQR